MFDVHVLTFNVYSIKDLSQEDSNIETEYKVYSKPFFSPRFILYTFFTLLLIIWWFGGWGFGVEVLDWAFGVGVFS